MSDVEVKNTEELKLKKEALAKEKAALVVLEAAQK